MVDNFFEPFHSLHFQGKQNKQKIIIVIIMISTLDRLYIQVIIKDPSSLYMEIR